MAVLALTAVGVLVTDQAVKLLLRRAGPCDSVRLGPYGSLRMVAGRLWVHRVSERSATALWLWVLSAGALVVSSGRGRKFVGGLGPGGGVGEVEAAGGVEGVFGCAAHESGRQE